MADATEPSMVDRLRAVPTDTGRVALLRAAGLLDDGGLGGLLDVAAGLVHGNPKAAQAVAEACAAGAATAGLPRVLPRAQYLCAQAVAVDGDLPRALDLVDAARRGWLGQGAHVEAMRTTLGRMHVLNELGRHPEAVSSGEELLAMLGANGAGLAPQARDRLRAELHQNLGACYSFVGDYELALASYDECETHFSLAGTPVDVAEARYNRGEVLLELGRASDALDAFEQAAESFAAADQARTVARVVSQIGRAQLLRGSFVDALASFERARLLLDELGVRADRDVTLLSTAEAYRTLNLFEEAIATYREAAQSLRAGGSAHYLARALAGLGSAYLAAGMPAEAGAALAEAAGAFEAAGNAGQLSAVLVEQAAVRAALGAREDAVALAGRALALLSGRDLSVPRAYAHLRMADLASDPDVVQGHLLAAGEIAADLALPQLRYRVDLRLGQLRRRQGRVDEARTLLEASVATIEDLRATVRQEAMRASFLRDKVDAYTELVELWLDRGDEAGVRKAFEVAERAKSRALVDLLTGLAGARIAEAADPELAGRLRRLEGDLRAIYDELLDGEGGGRGHRRPVMRRRAAELEEQIGLLRLRAPAGSVEDPVAVPLTLDVLRERLPSELVVLAYHVLGDELVAFVSRAGSLAVVRDVSRMSRLRPLVERLAAQWQRFQAGPEFATRHATRLLGSTRQLLGALHTELMAPLLPLLCGATTEGLSGRPARVAVVPHDVLHQVPFHALWDGQAYVVERFEVSYAPSATVLGLDRPSPARSRPALVLGVAGADIPQAVEEATAVAAQLPGARLRTNDRATSSVLEREATGARVLHLACHGLFRQENPMFSALRLHDGWLTAADVLRLDLRGTVVALSACESGRSRVAGGGDEAIGLSRAFLGAGAAAVLVSLWLVQDDTTAALMGRYYELIAAGERPTAALRTAQLELCAHHPHPYHWAPFVLVGTPPEPFLEASS